jgi:anaerobic magnesium-protoporphyrin IX monomethyl ester cyclase
MRPDAVAALARARAREVWLGVESGSQKILDAMEKGSAVEEVVQATRNLRAQGIRVGWFVQLGYPGEEWDDLALTRELLVAEKPDDIGVSVAYPLPGTPFYDRVRMDLRSKANWSDSDDLAMMFRGTYSTHFYREIRDLLHAEVNARAERTAAPLDFAAAWIELERREATHRSPEFAAVRAAG